MKLSRRSQRLFVLLSLSVGLMLYLGFSGETSKRKSQQALPLQSDSPRAGAVKASGMSSSLATGQARVSEVEERPLEPSVVSDSALKQRREEFLQWRSRMSKFDFNEENTATEKGVSKTYSQAKILIEQLNEMLEQDEDQHLMLEAHEIDQLVDIAIFVSFHDGPEQTAEAISQIYFSQPDQLLHSLGEVEAPAARSIKEILASIKEG